MAATADEPSTEDLSPAVLGQLLDALPDGARVLDLGCGNGSFGYMHVPNLQIDALDEFPEPRQPLPAHVQYRQGRAEALPYDDDRFDLIVTNFVMEHVTDFPQALAEITRVLKRGGHLYMAVPNSRSFEDALFRGLFAGGGHIQRHTFESVMATVYRLTPLKLIGYIEWPAGFVFLEDREGLRALAATVVAACRETLGVDIRARSNYIFVFRRESGRGWVAVAAVCGYCGSGVTDGADVTAAWICPSCGRTNPVYTPDDASDDHLDTDMQTLWARYPALRDAAEPAPIAEAAVVEAERAVQGERAGHTAQRAPAPLRPVTPEQDLLRRVRRAVRMLRHGNFG